MSQGMPELGSKISLISKSDIRYEGRLFTVDPHECTIALAQVRSFGTEDRECPFPVVPQNEIYDYILFRGSDIKDIRVVNNPPLNDPAIVQLSVPPLAQSAYQNPGLSHAALSHLGQGGLGQYAGQAFATAYQSYGNLGGIPPGTNLAPGIGVPRGNPVTGVQKQLNQQLSELSPPLQMPQQPSQVPVPTKEQASVLELIGGSRSSTATPVPGVTRKSPTIDQGVQVSSSRKDGGEGQQQQKKGQQWQQQQQHQQHQHTGWESKQGNWGQQQYQAPQPQRVQQRSQGGQGGWKGGQSQGGGGGGTGGGNPGAGAGGRRGRGQRGGGPSFSNRNQQQQQKKNVLKFEGDYDFEQANEEFEELKSQLGKMKISTGTTPTASETSASTPAPVSSAVSPKVNGEDKKDDSGNETAIGDGEQEDDSDVIFYDKSKSFYDNISCEAVERSKGHSQRTDWRQERKLNSETFGVASARRGGYRGRGYYGYRGMGNMFGRGGYRGYRGGQGNRGRGNFGGWGPSQQQMANNTAVASNVSK